MNNINIDSCILSDPCAVYVTSESRSHLKQIAINNDTLDNIYFNRFFNRSLTDTIIDSYITNNQSNQTLIFQDSRLPCDCIKQTYDCKIFKKILQRNLIQNEALRNAFMGLYLTIMMAAILVNFVLIILIFKTQEKSCCATLIKRITQQSGNSINKIKAKRMNLYNLDNNMLLISLLISYLMTIFYVLPRQLALFYSGIITHGIECKFTEFIKAFTVSLTIFSLVAISLQQLISLKYCTIMNSYSSLNNESLSGFLKKIFQRKDFITWTLFVLSWLFAFTIGYFYMSPFEDEILKLEFYEIFVQKPLSCKFPSYLRSKYEYCTINSNLLNTDTINISLFIILLVIPNFIIFLSYGYICYHIWSSSRNILNGYDKTTEQEQVFYVSIQNSPYQKVSKLNYNEILEVIQTYSSGILTQEQIISLFNTIKEKEYSSPVSIDINFVPKYNGFQVETIIKTVDKKLQKNSLSTSNIIKKRNKTVTMTICLMAICFTLCWFPFFSFALFYSKIKDYNLYINLKVTIHLIGYSSSVWSPLIYILRCEKFKNSVKPLFIAIKLRFKNYFIQICKGFKKDSNTKRSKSIRVFKTPLRGVRVNPDEY